MSLLSTSLDSLSAGILPKWLLFISLVSLANSVQSYTSLSGTRQVYIGSNSSSSSSITAASKLKNTSTNTSTSPVTPLSARTFGTWTFITSLVRLQAALAIHDPVAYRLAFATFAVAWGHFALEWLVFGTARWGRGLAGPVVVSSVSIGWMWWGWGYYVLG